jgi:hypothetical protein
MIATSADRLFNAGMLVNGSERDDLYKCIESMVVTEDPERGSTFEVRIALCRNDDGSWPHVEDPKLKAWNEVELVAAFPDGPETILHGYISHVTMAADRSGGAITLTIQGVDALYLLQKQDKCRVWREKSYEQIAVDVIKKYSGLTAVPSSAPDPGAAPEDLPAVTQRGTDFRLLRELARRLGFEFFADNKAIHFHPPELDGTPQKLIAAMFGDETNCDSLRVLEDGTLPTAVRMSCVNPFTGEIETPVEATASDLTPLGTTDLKDLQGSGVPATDLVLRRLGAQPRRMLTALTLGAMRRHNWWVTATGTLNGLRYGKVLRAQRTVTIKGFGSIHNGVYYVRKVKHRLGPRSYSMEFEAVRNRTGQLGTENMTGESPE